MVSVSIRSPLHTDIRRSDFLSDHPLLSLLVGASRVFWPHHQIIAIALSRIAGGTHRRCSAQPDPLSLRRANCARFRLSFPGALHVRACLRPSCQVLWIPSLGNWRRLLYWLMDARMSKPMSSARLCVVAASLPNGGDDLTTRHHILDPGVIQIVRGWGYAADTTDGFNTSREVTAVIVQSSHGLLAKTYPLMPRNKLNRKTQPGRVVC